MESHLPFLDELILVDNESTDKTKEICKNFKKRYPNKVKFFEYPYRVTPPSEKNKNIPSNSVNSLAYYYNWCFSKTKYSHVMKVDDDNFLISEKMGKIREKALSSKKYYNMYWWINLVKDKDWKIWILKWYEYSWKWWDHWIYPVSPFTYYLQWEYCEQFINNLQYMRNWFSFFHLKFLKPNYWFHNLIWDSYQKWYESKIKKWEYEYDIESFLWKNKDINLNKYIKDVA